MNIRTGLVLALAAAAVAAHATDVTYTNTIGLTTTNYTQGFTLPKFDTTLGTLTGISFSLQGNVAGSARAESLDAAPSALTLNLGANISLVDPTTNTTLAVVLPVVNNSFNATVFDGVIDFGGTSGVTFANLNATASTSSGPSLTPSLTAIFVGTGNVTLNVNATGSSAGTGAGNLLTQFATQAGSVATVTYSYAPVPEPASCAALGLGALALLRRRRKA